MTSRRRFTTLQRAALFERHKGVCHICQRKITPVEPWEIEHVIAWELTRDDSDENLRPAHKTCHKDKTREDVRGIRKADRVKAKHLGAKKPGRGWQSKWKKKLDGRVVRRSEDG
jgi:5-methylcytosine-specific restriction protein A